MKFYLDGKKISEKKAKELLSKNQLNELAQCDDLYEQIEFMVEGMQTIIVELN